MKPADLCSEHRISLFDSFLASHLSAGEIVENGASASARYDLVVAISHIGEEVGMKRFMIFSVIAVLAGCSGKIVTYEQSDCKNGCEGVPFFRLVQVKEHYIQDKILNKEGEMLRYAGGDENTGCFAVQVTETKLIPAAQESYIRYEAGWLETSKFLVDLNDNGSLAKVGADSTPGLKMAVDAVSTLATAYGTVKSADKSKSKIQLPYCNAGRVPVTGA
ncbi:hypothetical protein HBO34_13290 [Pseudomonas veronii]|uniref:hypothetical protein n=1 Tax=Pseudomonas veronii TaxID=76761 RepID=UPI001474A09B|nr:hypothetical protein [Pseudomonas veronii]NMX38843.1 hypothetical protein [Pseudomonas veronii]